MQTIQYDVFYKEMNSLLTCVLQLGTIIYVFGSIIYVFGSLAFLDLILSGLLNKKLIPIICERTGTKPFSLGYFLYFVLLFNMSHFPREGFYVYSLLHTSTRYIHIFKHTKIKVCKK